MFANPDASSAVAASEPEAALRTLDITMAIAALVVFAPLMLLVALAIVIEDGRPIFFSQLRLGRDGRPFRMYKFRKFYERGRCNEGALTMERDPRLTGVGAVLARTKLDELPQFWNVLKGEMAIVGPRPESMAFQDCFAGPYLNVLKFKPGIFGPSQVMFRSEACLYRGCPDPEQLYRDVVFPMKARIDLAYFPHRTLLGDVRWAVRCGLAVFRRSAAPEQASLQIADPERVGQDRSCDTALGSMLAPFTHRDGPGQPRACDAPRNQPITGARSGRQVTRG